MCLIIWKQINHYISDQRLAEAHAANPDGCGIMWAADNQIHWLKGIWDFELFISLFNKCYQEYGDRNYIIHFRTASASDIGKDFCHPFEVNKNLAFMQNGNLFEFSDYFPGRKQDGKSDVQRFNEEILKRLPADFLMRNKSRQALERYNAECFSKFIFLDNHDNITIINESAGEWINGIWYSNGGIDNYIGYGYSGAYYYHPGCRMGFLQYEIRHKGGLMNVEMLGDNKKKWVQCESCQGWFRRENLIQNNCSGCRTYKELCQETIK